MPYRGKDAGGRYRPEHDRRDHKLTVRVHQRDYDAVAAMAERQGTPMAAVWVELLRRALADTEGEAALRATYWRTPEAG